MKNTVTHGRGDSAAREALRALAIVWRQDPASKKSIPCFCGAAEFVSYRPEAHRHTAECHRAATVICGEAW
jgi:hypothetical protein